MGNPGRQHPKGPCSSEDCRRPLCVGYRLGYEEGYDEGFADGVRSCKSEE